MKIQLVSDLHLEFLKKEEIIELVNSLYNKVDVLVLAGDIATVHVADFALTTFSKRFKNSKIVWIHGNHEYYHSDKESVHELSCALQQKLDNLYWLHNDFVEINDKKIFGTSLWFSRTPDIDLFKHKLNDFRYISNFEHWVYKDNTKAIKFLRNNIRKDDIVVTHHLPLQNSINEIYRNNDLNRFFLCDMQNIIKLKRPKLWFHGHTHFSLDYVYEHTRIVCNPRGYVPCALNKSFNNKLIIEV